MSATYLGEIHQHFSHFITTLTTSHIDNDITVGELGHTLRDDGLAAPERTRDTDGATLNTREQRVQHSLSDNEWCVGGLLVGHRSGHTHRPDLHHAVLRLLALELDFQELLLHGVATGLSYPGDGTSGAGREQDLVVVHQAVFEDSTPDVTSGDVVADLVVARLEVPFPLTIQRIYSNATRDVDSAGICRDFLQGSLDTVVNRLHQTGAEFDGKRLACSVHGVTDSQTRCD